MAQALVLAWAALPVSRTRADVVGFAPGSEPAGAGATAIRLEYLPFTDPLAIFIALDQDGCLHLTRFFPSRLVVANAGVRPLSAAERKRVLALLAAPALRQALRAHMTGDGLTQGDQFRLGLANAAGMTDEAWGFRDAAPPALRELIDTVLGYGAPAQRLEPVPLADAYVRARLVEPARVDDLVRTTPVRIRAAAEFQADLRAALLQTIRDPLLFHPLTHAQRRALLAYRSLGDDVWLRVEGNGVYQLRVYSVERRSS